MNPLNTAHTTRVLGAPKDWDERKNGSCIGLPITDADGVMYSYWNPSWSERLLILVGRPVRLAVVGYTHPPVSVDAQP